MRFSTPIFFQRVEAGKYEATSGNYAPDTTTEEMRRASVADTGEATLRFVYGGIKEGSLTVCIQQPYTKPFDFIRIGDKRYSVDFSRHKKAFVVSEVQSNAEIHSTRD